MAITSPRQSSRDFRVAPPAFYGDLEAMLARGEINRALQEIVEWIRLTVETVNGLMDGRHNGHGTVTLTESSATTTLLDRRISANTKIHLEEIHANAATERGAGGLYLTYPNVTKGQAVINHVNSATADRTFSYVLAG